MVDTVDGVEEHSGVNSVSSTGDGGTVGERSNFKKNPTHTQDHGDA